MNIEDAMKVALEKPSLLEALEFIALWENERAVAQALEQKRDPNTGAMWDTCFKYAFRILLERWGKRAEEDPLSLDPFHDGWVQGMHTAADIAAFAGSATIATQLRETAKQDASQSLCHSERTEVIETFRRVSEHVEHDSVIDQIISPTWSLVAYSQSRDTDRAELERLRRFYTKCDDIAISPIEGDTIEESAKALWSYVLAQKGLAVHTIGWCPDHAAELAERDFPCLLCEVVKADTHARSLEARVIPREWEILNHAVTLIRDACWWSRGQLLSEEAATGLRDVFRHLEDQGTYNPGVLIAIRKMLLASGFNVSPPVKKK